MGRYKDAIALLEELCETHPESRIKMVYYALAYFTEKCNEDYSQYLSKVANAPVGKAYPSRFLEMKILKARDDEDAKLLLGCILYHKRQYEKAAKLFSECKTSYIAKRNLAVAYYSHLDRHEDAKKLMSELINERPDDAELLYEGIGQMNAGNYEKALEYLTEGQILPQSLGAGIWNHCKYIPMRYRAALCLDALGRHEEANEIYRYISSTEIEYFSNMHLPELPYYQAMSYDKLGECFKSRALITKYIRIWKNMDGVTDNGFFQTTPFFMPFIEEPKRLRLAKALYLNALIDRYLGNDDEADRKLCESYKNNNDNLFAKIM
jgi:tetratricopeptide (TPR) repeat protein